MEVLGLSRNWSRPPAPLHEAEDGIDELAYAIVDRGVILRSLDRGLVDFPSIRDGREVHLCWVAGEPEVRHWHEGRCRVRGTSAAVSRVAAAPAESKLL